MPETQYRVGPRALIYMILRKLKYPLIFAIVAGSLTAILLYVPQRLGVDSVNILSAIDFAFVVLRYAWIFILLLAFFLGLTALPEYFGMNVAMDEKALYIGSGILSRRYTVIPLDKIQSLTLAERATLSMFGLVAFTVTTDSQIGGEVTIPFIHRSLASDLQAGLLSRTHTNAH